ncbi:MAG: YifB family Mg chelatase-like AAA ATPase [Burkholderiaceae bacterium]
MSLAILASRALYGFNAQPVRVETHVGPGLPTFVIVGLPDAGVRESRERVRSALQFCGYEFPAGRITVNLAPADLPKDSGRFDLAIALGVLLATGQVQAARKSDAVLEIPDRVFVGELSLTGALGAVKGALAIAMAVAREAPGSHLVLPAESAAMAAQVPGLVVQGATSLPEVVDDLAGRQPMPRLQHASSSLTTPPGPCLSEVSGQEGGRRALEIAACGGHSLLMCGPPGVGKSMLAQRLPGLLPPLSIVESLEVAALHGLAGNDVLPSLLPPFRAPHHTASTAAIIGGGTWPRPGEISLAHQGVLFLDEVPEFHRPVLESLREPLETGVVSIARARLSCTFPARFQLVAAMNPCPCGWAGHPRKPCVCPPARVDAYRRRLSGPLMDRIDLHIDLAPPEGSWLDAAAGESSALVRARVIACRERQLARQGCANALLSPSALREYAVPDNDGSRLLRDASERWAWSARAVHRVLRAARTVADMDGSDTVRLPHVAEALQFRPAWNVR